MTLHLYEFESSGYYAAETREAAILRVMVNLHYDREEAEEEFLREVPDDEIIKAHSDDSFEDERQVETRKPCLYSKGEQTFYSLELTAAEHAALAPEWGYCFGGEQ